MTTTTHKRPSLRDLARRLGVSHSHLSEQIHAGMLTRGVAIGANGRAVVTDLGAAVAAYNGAPAAREAESIALNDPTYACRTTAAKVFEQRDAAMLLVTALTSLAIGVARDRGKASRALQKRIAARLRVIGWMHGAGAEEMERAERELESVLEMLADGDEDDEPKGGR